MGDQPIPDKKIVPELYIIVRSGTIFFRGCPTHLNLMRNSEMNRAHGWLIHFCSLCTLLISMLSHIQTKWYQLSAIYDGPPLSRKEWRECLPAIDHNSLCTAGWRDNKILLPHQSAIISHNSHNSLSHRLIFTRSAHESNQEPW